MSIIRNKNRNHYVVVDQCLADDMSVSLAAKGLQLYLLGRPDNWSANVTHLARATGHTRKHVYKLVNELIAAGYLARAQGFTPAGKFQAVTYDIIESPSRRKSTDSPCIQNDSPCIQTRLASNGEAVLDTLTNTELTNTEYKKISSSSDDERENEYASFDAFWDQWPKKVDKDQARKRWNKLKPDQYIFDKIMANIEAHALAGDWEDRQYIPGPAKYLLNRKWEDEVYKPQQESTNGRRKQDNQTRAEFHASTADFIDIHDDNALDRFGG